MTTDANPLLSADYPHSVPSPPCGARGARHPPALTRRRAGRGGRHRRGRRAPHLGRTPSSDWIGRPSGWAAGSRPPRTWSPSPRRRRCARRTTPCCRRCPASGRGLPLNQALWARVRAFSETEEAAVAGGAAAAAPGQDREGVPAGRSRPPGRRAAHVWSHSGSSWPSFSRSSARTCWTPPPPTNTWWRTRRAWPASRKRPARRARVKAEEKGLEGWLITLDYPSVEPILKYADDRALRREIHEAYATRCRDGEFDNRALIARILRLRKELADLLGYDSFPGLQARGPHGRHRRPGHRLRAGHGRAHPPLLAT